MTADASIAIDIGGTFTDVVLQSGSDLYLEKTLTTHDDLLRGFLSAVEAALAKAALKPCDVEGRIVHATTVVTNALIERKGEPTAMVFTQGFSDVLEVRDERRYDMYDPQIEFPEPLVDAEHTLTIDERVFADGTVGREIDDVSVERLCRQLKERGIVSVGVCLLHSYRNAVNERRLGEALQQRMPELFVSLSSEIAPQIREYLRASTTAVNAYAVPITTPYLDRLEQELKGAGYPTSPLIMLSSGGVVGPRTAGRMPVRMIESGPAAGALGAAIASERHGNDQLLAFDMGGTTAKICLIQDRRPLVNGRFEIDRMYRFKEGSGLPVTVPCVDLIEIGAGGGSIAHVNAIGLLNVGPQSAGSMPGPACYAQGGQDATVTDANVVLGTIDAENFLGGTMRLDREAAERAVKSIAERIELGPLEAARGIYNMVCETMASAMRAPRRRPRRRFPRHPDARIRRRRPGACLSCRRTAQEPDGDLSGDGQRLFRLRRPGHAAEARPCSQRPRLVELARLERRRRPL